MGLYYVNMFAETMPQPDFGGREEYNQTAEAKLHACGIITDAIDTLLHASIPSGGTVEHGADTDESGLHIKRSFRYIEAQNMPGGTWPLTERLFSIVYAFTRSEPYTHETYTIAVNAFVPRARLSNLGTQNKYVIEYFGANRESATATIEQPTLTEDGKTHMEDRLTTPYDQAQLAHEIAALQNAIDAGEHERSIIAQLNATTE